MQLEALGLKAVVVKDEPEAKSAGGIIIPDNCKQRPITGIVKSVGLGAYNAKGNWVPTTLQPGDKILFPKYSGTNATIEGEEFFIVSENDVLAVL